MQPTRCLLKRSVWKGANIVPLPIVRQPGKDAPPVRTQARSAAILPSFVGLKFLIHNGKTYTPITVVESMVGHKLGEFAPDFVPPGRRHLMPARLETRLRVEGGKRPKSK